MANLKLDFVRDGSLPNKFEYVIIVLGNDETRLVCWSGYVFHSLWSPSRYSDFGGMDDGGGIKAAWTITEIKAWAAIPTTIKIDAIERVEL